MGFERRLLLCSARKGAYTELEASSSRSWREFAVERRAWKLVASTMVPTLSGPLVLRSKVGTPYDAIVPRLPPLDPLSRRDGVEIGE